MSIFKVAAIESEIYFRLRF